MAENTVFENEKAEGAGQARALGFFLLKRYEDAVAVYDDLLKKEPDNIDFWLNRMICRLQYSSPDVSFFDKMIDKVRLLPSQGYLCLAEVMNDLGRRKDALVFVDKALEKEPENIDAYVLKAFLLTDSERFDDLYALMRSIYPRFKKDERVLCLAALYALTFRNTRQAGYLLKKALKRNRCFVIQNKLFYWVMLSLGKEREIIDFAAQALEARRDNPFVWCGLAQANKALGNDGDADLAFDVLSDLIDMSEAMRVQWVQVLMNVGKYDRAFDLLLSLYQDTEEYWLLLQNFFDDMRLTGQTEECARYAEAFRTRFKKSSEARFICDTVLNKDRNENRPLSLVRMTSDLNAGLLQAETSDATYRLPFLSGRVLKMLKEPVSTSKDVLDLGCGTGAMASVLEKYSRPNGSLTGVDISPEVLKYAENQGKYTALREDDLISFCRGRENAKRYDLIVCMDVLFGFSDLTPVFKAVKQALKGDGVFIFSILPLTDDSLFFKFDSGLFYHTADYVSARLKSVKLQEECRLSELLYRDGEPCLIFAARRKK